jgi:hypothetical protein
MSGLRDSNAKWKSLRRRSVRLRLMMPVRSGDLSIVCDNLKSLARARPLASVNDIGLIRSFVTF